MTLNKYFKLKAITHTYFHIIIFTCLVLKFKYFYLVNVSVPGTGPLLLSLQAHTAEDLKCLYLHCTSEGKLTRGQMMGR